MTLNENAVTKNIIKSYSENIGFPVYTSEELQRMYHAFGVDPTSSDRRVFDLESMSHHLQHEVIKLIRSMDINKADLVLDAGCGNGAPSRLMAKICRCRIKGFDINPNQIKKALDCDHLEGVNHLIEREVMDVHKLNYSAESFDKVFHNESICHWLNKKTALAGLFRVLKKGGVMGFHDWARGDKGDLNGAGGAFTGTYAEGVWFQHSIEETRQLLEYAGFRVLHAEDTTDTVDRGLRARLRELMMSQKLYLKSTSDEYLAKSLQYFRVMIETHYDYLRYARFVCVKN
jgi:ubiquinone/menaquinone biosynthesis C-methylase UbiE